MEERCKKIFEKPRYGYAVMGECGEADDRHTWLVCIYLSELEADAHAGFATQRALELYGPKDQGNRWSIARYIELQTQKIKYQNQYDPEMDIDYTGTKYDVEKVILAF